jgi:hypothetical protein
MDPEQRQKHVDRLLELDGLSHITEDPHAAYCPISLTSTPAELKPYVSSRQKTLMQQVLAPAGITAYDPNTAPYSPDTNLVSQPSEVYLVDSGKIVGAQYFVGHNLLPSTGQGIEAEKAKFYVRKSVILIDGNVRVSRMQPNRAIYLQYSHFEQQAGRFAEVFKLLQQYDVGVGLHDKIPVMLGFERGTTAIVDLEELVYREFEDLQYKYDGHTPILTLRAQNPELFYEHTS